MITRKSDVKFDLPFMTVLDVPLQQWNYAHQFIWINFLQKGLNQDLSSEKSIPIFKLFSVIIENTVYQESTTLFFHKYIIHYRLQARQVASNFLFYTMLARVLLVQYIFVKILINWRHILNPFREGWIFLIFFIVFF